MPAVSRPRPVHIPNRIRRPIPVYRINTSKTTIDRIEIVQGDRSFEERGNPTESDTRYSARSDEDIYYATYADALAAIIAYHDDRIAETEDALDKATRRKVAALGALATLVPV